MSEKEQIQKNPKFELLRLTVTSSHVAMIFWFAVAMLLDIKPLLFIPLSLMVLSIYVSMYSASLEGFEDWLKKRTGRINE